MALDLVSMCGLSLRSELPSPGSTGPRYQDTRNTRFTHKMQSFLVQKGRKSQYLVILYGHLGSLDFSFLYKYKKRDDWCLFSNTELWFLFLNTSYGFTRHKNEPLIACVKDTGGKNWQSSCKCMCLRKV